MWTDAKTEVQFWETDRRTESESIKEKDENAKANSSPQKRRAQIKQVTYDLFMNNIYNHYTFISLLEYKPRITKGW